MDPDEKFCTLKKSKERSPASANYENCKGNINGLEFTTDHRLYKHKKLNSHTKNRLEKSFKETESISHSKKKIPT